MLGNLFLSSHWFYVNIVSNQCIRLGYIYLGRSFRSNIEISIFKNAIYSIYFFTQK